MEMRIIDDPENPEIRKFVLARERVIYVNTAAGRDGIIKIIYTHASKEKEKRSDPT